MFKPDDNGRPLILTPESRRLEGCKSEAELNGKSEDNVGRTARPCLKLKTNKNKSKGTGGLAQG